MANFAQGQEIEVANAASATLDSTGTILTVLDGSNNVLQTIHFSTSYTGKTFYVAGGIISLTEENFWQASGSNLGGDWSDPSHWSSGSVPPSVSANVTIPSLNNAFTVTNVGVGGQLTSLTINSNSGTILDVGAGSLSIHNSLNVIAGHITLEGGTISVFDTPNTGIELASGTDLIGYGVVRANNSVPGSGTIFGAGTVGASGGTLTIEADVTNLGTLQVGDSSELDLGGVSSANTLKFLGSDGELTIGIFGPPTTALTLTNALSIGSNLVELGLSAALTDNAGITINNGILTAEGGEVSGAITATGAATIEARGGEAA